MRGPKDSRLLSEQRRRKILDIIEALERHGVVGEHGGHVAIVDGGEMKMMLGVGEDLPGQVNVGRIVVDQQDFGRAFQCRDRTSPALFTGRVNLKVDPCPGWDSTQIRPPFCSRIFLQTARPMPLPAYSA